VQQAGKMGGYNKQRHPKGAIRICIMIAAANKRP